ncbi:MAG: alpha-galactosidase [Bacteroidales bacterium]|nr:alpha-galactosidase [Bacteroidales bacterium]
MKKTLILASCLLLLASQLMTARQTMKMTPKEQACSSWIEKHFSGSTTPPFSFSYDGRHSDSFLKKWKFSKTKAITDKDGKITRSFIWTEKPQGLQVECKVSGFTDFNAMEWVLYFRNLSGEDSGRISDVKAVDIDLASSGDGKWDLFYAKGSDASKEDFMAMTKEYSLGDTLTMTPWLGRSSSRSFPYFNVKTPTGGMVFAIGWSGSWKAEITRPEENKFRVSTGLKTLDAFLRPGEEIRTPLTAMIPWQGEDRMDGQNILRRFILRHHFPRSADGSPIEPPICSSFNYGDPFPCNEYTCMTAEYGIALIHRYEQFHLLPEVFWLDAGWYDKASDYKNGYNWANAVGNWVPDKSRFPNGLGDIADAAHDAGCRFMVWFEPERVVKDSYWANEHPEFLLQAGGGKVVPVKPGGPDRQDSFLFNLGNEDANKWLREKIAGILRENRIDYYRQDFNIDPEWFWLSNDEPGRSGICEIRYIEGLYKFWDYLLEQFPGILIDNCASGGRRLDLEATSRSIALWRTDYNYGEPIGYQCHTYGLSQWLPASGTGLGRPDPFTTRSSYNAAVTFNWKITSADFNIQEMQKRLAEFHSFKKYFLEDFYPLTGYGDTTRDDIWLAYQLDRPSDSTGMVVAFRRQDNKQEEIVVKMKNLDPEKTYVLEDQDTFDKMEKTGLELSEGLVLSLPQPRSSLCFTYKVKE